MNLIEQETQPQLHLTRYGRTLEERFWDKVKKTETCWIWTAAICDGYGNFLADTKSLPAIPVRAHRLAYEMLVGPIPAGMEIHHKCKVRACVNPDHLEPLTRKTHKRHHTKTHCPSGHEYSPGNIRSNAINAKLCVLCYEELKRKRRLATQAKRMNRS